MKEKVLRSFDYLEKQRFAILKKAESLHSQQFELSPGEGRWSMAEVLAHIIKAEALSLKYMERMYSRIDDVPNAGILSSVRFQLLKWGLNLPMKYKAPAMADTTGTVSGLDELEREWERIRNRLKRLIETCDEDCLKKAIYKHPRAGYLNLRQAVVFMSLHIQHHEGQINELLDL